MRRLFPFLGVMLSLLVSFLGCSASKPAAVAIALAPEATAPEPKLDSRPPAALRYLPAELAGVALVHDPLALVNALGREQLMKEQQLDYERSSAYMLRTIGVNLLHPEGWEDAGIDPRGPAGMALLKLDGSLLFFATPSSKERVKAAIYRMVALQKTPVDMSLRSGALILTLEARSIAFIVRDDIVILLSTRHELLAQATQLAGLAEADSLFRAEGVAQALKRTGRGRNGLAIANLPVFLRNAVGPMVAKLLPRQGSPLVAALRLTESGVLASWSVPLPQSSPWRRLLVPRTHPGLAIRAKQPPLQMLDLNVDLPTLAGELERLGASAPVVALARTKLGGLSGGFSELIHRELQQRLVQAIEENRRLTGLPEVPLHAQLTSRTAGSASGVLEQLSRLPLLGSQFRHEAGAVRLQLGALAGTVTTQGSELVYMADSTPSLAGSDASRTWTHPHVSELARLLNSKGTALTFAIDNAVMDLSMHAFRASHISVDLPDSRSMPTYSSNSSETADFAEERSERDAAEERSERDAAEERSERDAAEERRERDAAELGLRTSTMPQYTKAKQTLEDAQRERQAIEDEWERQSLLRWFGPEHPRVIAVLRAKVAELGLEGEAALIVNTPDVSSWIPRYLLATDLRHAREAGAVAREAELAERANAASEAMQAIEARVKGEIEAAHWQNQGK